MIQHNIVRRTLPEPEIAAGPVHENALLSRILIGRGIRTTDELSVSLSSLPRPEAMPQIDLAVERLATAVMEQQSIMIVGDYDCDGATSTAVALLALKQLGAERVDFRVPDRFRFGYGLSPEIVDSIQASRPDLILTVDNGVASVDGVDKANSASIDVVVTDHHLPPDHLPAALAIVNPSLKGSEFPSQALAGVGVIFYVMLALRARLLEARWFEQKSLEAPKLAELLDLVAIGTVADVVPLDRVNRILVEQGLRRIRTGHTRPGIEALLRISGRQQDRLTSTDIGFAIGPRLNAAGRLDDMSTGIRCLLTADQQEADELATSLNQLNSDRRVIEDTMRQEAEQVLERLASLNKSERSIEASRTIVLYDENWHEGVIGILAGRLKEQHHKPVVIFARSEDGKLKGSGRSIPDLHLRDALLDVVANAPGMIDKCGGHAMAAGLTLSEIHLGAFKVAFENVVRQRYGDHEPERQWLTDGELSAADASLQNAELLQQVLPWGQGFPPPLFDGLLVARSVRVLKDRHTKLSVELPGSDQRIDAIAFNQVLDWPVGEQRRAVYGLSVNDYRGVRSVQFLIEHVVAPELQEQDALG